MKFKNGRQRFDMECFCKMIFTILKDTENFEGTSITKMQKLDVKSKAEKSEIDLKAHI